MPLTQAEDSQFFDEFELTEEDLYVIKVRENEFASQQQASASVGKDHLPRPTNDSNWQWKDTSFLNLNTQLNKFRSENDSLQQKISSLKQEHQLKCGEVSLLRQNCSNLEKENFSYRTVLSQLQSQQEASQSAAVDATEKQISQLQSELLFLQHELSLAHTSLRSLRRQPPSAQPEVPPSKKKPPTIDAQKSPWERFLEGRFLTELSDRKISVSVDLMKTIQEHRFSDALLLLGGEQSSFPIREFSQFISSAQADPASPLEACGDFDVLFWCIPSNWVLLRRALLANRSTTDPKFPTIDALKQNAPLLMRRYPFAEGFLEFFSFFYDLALFFPAEAAAFVYSIPVSVFSEVFLVWLLRCPFALFLATVLCLSFECGIGLERFGRALFSVVWRIQLGLSAGGDCPSEAKENAKDFLRLVEQNFTEGIFSSAT